jgi:hypothetical protein
LTCFDFARWQLGRHQIVRSAPKAKKNSYNDTVGRAGPVLESSTVSVFQNNCCIRKLRTNACQANQGPLVAAVSIGKSADWPLQQTGLHIAGIQIVRISFRDTKSTETAQSSMYLQFPHPPLQSRTSSIPLGYFVFARAGSFCRKPR